MHKNKCPICGKTSDIKIAPAHLGAGEELPKYKPFCSKRCADIDLGKWLGESYAIPSEEVESNEELAIESDDE